MEKVASSGNPFILIAFSGPGNNTSEKHHEALIDAVCRWGAGKNIMIVFKLHPKDRKEYYKAAIIRHRLDNVQLMGKEEIKNMPSSIFDWLSCSKVLVTGASAVANEAMLMRVPVVTMDFMQEYKNVEFIESGATFHTRNWEDFRSVMDRLMNEEKPDISRSSEYISRYFYQERIASEVIAGKIENLITAKA